MRLTPTSTWAHASSEFAQTQSLLQAEWQEYNMLIFKILCGSNIEQNLEKLVCTIVCMATLMQHSEDLIDQFVQ